MPGAPIDLCVRCITVAYQYAADCLPVGQADQHERLDDFCPYCEGRSLLRNKVTGDVRCVPILSGCDRPVPSLRDLREQIIRDREEREAAAAAECVQEAVRNDARYAVGVSQIYYIQLGDRIKIGVSVDPGKRVRSLSLNDSHIAAVEPGTSVTERQRHRQFAHLRLHGEWFRAAPDLLDHIATLQASAAA